MARRTNPWPAFVDLFSALLIASFAGFIMMAGAYHQQVGGIEEQEQAKESVRREALRIVKEVIKSLLDSGIQTVVRQCGDDTCIELYAHFETGADALAEPDRRALMGACEIIRKALDGLPSDQRKDIELVIEGHSDRQPPRHRAGNRSDFRYNWNLSAMRASSVLYEFKECGLTPPDYQVVAHSYGASVPLCEEDTDECYEKNRRTTLRLRANTQQIETRLKTN